MKKKRKTKYDKAHATCIAIGVEKTFRLLFASGAIDHKRLTISQMVSMAKTVDGFLRQAHDESFAAGFERGNQLGIESYKRAKSVSVRYAKIRAWIVEKWRELN